MMMHTATDYHNVAAATTLPIRQGRLTASLSPPRTDEPRRDLRVRQSPVKIPSCFLKDLQPKPYHGIVVPFDKKGNDSNDDSADYSNNCKFVDCDLSKLKLKLKTKKKKRKPPLPTTGILRTSRLSSRSDHGDPRPHQIVRFNLAANVIHHDAVVVQDDQRILANADCKSTATTAATISRCWYSPEECLAFRLERKQTGAHMRALLRSDPQSIPAILFRVYQTFQSAKLPQDVRPIEGATQAYVAGAVTGSSSSSLAAPHHDDDGAVGGGGGEDDGSTSHGGGHHPEGSVPAASIDCWVGLERCGMPGMAKAYKAGQAHLLQQIQDIQGCMKRQRNIGDNDNNNDNDDDDSTAVSPDDATATASNRRPAVDPRRDVVIRALSRQNSRTSRLYARYVADLVAESEMD